MGLIDRYITPAERARIRARAVKAIDAGVARAVKAIVPAGASTLSEAQNMGQAQQAAGPAYSMAAILPRTDPQVPFGPGPVLAPVAINPIEDWNRPLPRRTDYDVSWNLPGGGNPLVPWRILRDVASKVDVLRRCIEVRKSQLQSLDWEIVISPHATSRIMTEQNIKTPGEAANIARKALAGPMLEARKFMETPDKPNGLNFSDWLGLVLEDMFVLDAVSIYPQMTLGGQLLALQNIDGATIKPLLDHTGNRPQPPQPAYQQIIYGFPRGEFVASDDVGPLYMADRLVYAPRHRRPWIPYGFSQVEQAISVADMYLKRTGQLRAEFTDGTRPGTIMKTDISISALPQQGKFTPQQLHDYQKIYNDDLAGQTEERAHTQFIPQGFDPVVLKSFAEMYTSEYDEFLIKLLCMCFDVMPTEIGFQPKGGLGGKGMSEGEENSTYRKAIRPTVVWLQNLITGILRTYLSMPDDLEFAFLGYEVEDQHEVEQTEDLRVRGGRKTINESRADAGLPLLPFQEADEVFVVTGAGIQFINGALALQEEAATPQTAPTNARPIDSTPQPPVPPGPPAPTVKEAAAFVRYTSRRVGKSWRDFEFKTIDPATAERLNALGADGDLDAVKLAVVDVGKASAPRRGARFDKHRAELVKAHTPAVHKAVQGCFPGASTLAHAWTTTKGIDPDVRARARKVVDAHTSNTHIVASALTPVQRESYERGAQAAAELTGGGDTTADPASSVDTIDKIATGLVAGYAAALATQMAGSGDDDLEERLGDVLAGPDTASLSVDYMAGIGSQQGAADEYEKRGIENLEIELDDEACDLCEQYDGPFTGIRPPFHAACGCSIVPSQGDNG